MPSTASRSLTPIPGVGAGRTIIAGTRIDGHEVVGRLQNGATVDTVIPRCFPELKRSQVYEWLAYDEAHRPEIDGLVAEQMAEDSERLA